MTEQADRHVPSKETDSREPEPGHVVINRIVSEGLLDEFPERMKGVTLDDGSLLVHTILQDNHAGIYLHCREGLATVNLNSSKPEDLAALQEISTDSERAKKALGNIPEKMAWLKKAKANTKVVNLPGEGKLETVLTVYDGAEQEWDNFISLLRR